MLHNEARKLLIEAWNKTHKAKEIAECFSVNTSTVYRLEKRMRECAILIRKHCRAREKRYSLRLCRFFHLCRVSKTFEISRIPIPL